MVQAPVARKNMSRENTISCYQDPKSRPIPCSSCELNAILCHPSILQYSRVLQGNWALWTVTANVEPEMVFPPMQLEIQTGN